VRTIIVADRYDVGVDAAIERGLKPKSDNCVVTTSAGQTIRLAMRSDDVIVRVNVPGWAQEHADRLDAACMHMERRRPQPPARNR
jgi:hypothetical protein